jgi:lipid A 3-O-deacylase
MCLGEDLYMERKLKRFCLGLVFFGTVCLGFATAQAEEPKPWRVFVGYGHSHEYIDIFRFGIQRDFRKEWFVSRVGRLTGYHEASVGIWYHRDDVLGAIAYSPVFTYRFNMRRVEPYIEAGIGFALLTEREIYNRDMSTIFQFEDRFGVGVRLGASKQHDFNFRYMHYSNAATVQPNQGIDILITSYAVHF